MEETKKEEKKNELDLKIERQKFQMKKKGMEDISSSVKEVSESIEKLAESLSPKEIGDGASFIVKGLKGDKGEKGNKGDKGEQGIQGKKGDKGDSIKGDKGEQGFKGGQGLKGDKGENGLNGKDGKNGIDGKDGSPDSPDEIVSKLQGVKKQWLSIEAIDGDFNTKVTKVINQLGTTSGLKEVAHDATLSGSGTDADPLKVIGGGGSGIVETIVAGTGISVDSTDPANPIVTNDSPDQTVSITGTGSATVTGTYPDFTIDVTGSGGDMLASVYDPAAGAKQVAFADELANYLPLSGGIMTGGLTVGADLAIYNAGAIVMYSDEGGALTGQIGATTTGEYSLYNMVGQSATLDTTGLGADRTFAFPDASGTLALTSDIPDVTGKLNLDQTTPQNIINGRPIFDDGLQLGLTPTIGTTSIGKMTWDVDWKTPVVELEDDVRLQIGQETMAYVYNGTGSTITQGQVVYTSGTQGGVPSVSLAQGDVDATSRVLGLVTSTSIPTGEYGYVTIRGHVNNIDTSAWSAGDQVYLSADTAGALTNVKPNTGDYDTRVGRVMLVDASTGRVYVNIMIEYQPGVISGGAGVDFYLDDATIYATSANNTYPVKTLLKTPNTSAEDVDSIVCNNNTVLYGEYLWQTGLGDTTIQGGTWTFDIYAGVSSATNVSSLTQNIYRSRPEAGTITISNVVGTTATATASTGTPFAITKIDPSANIADASYLMITNNTTGLYPITARTSDTVVTITVPAGYTPAAASTFQVQKKLFGVSTGEINNVATAPLYAGLQLYSVTTVQPAYTILSTDQLGTKMFGVSTGARTIYFAHNGTTRYSHFTSPLITRHNDLAGLQGGATGDYYHLTSAQATIATQSATTDRSGYLTDTDWDTFNNKQNALTNPITGTGTANEIAYFPTTSTVGSLAVATYPSLTELSYVKGVTSAIQTQLGGKQSTISFGTGVQTALGVNIGAAGAPVLFNGALGTPSSGTLTNCTFPTLNQNTSGTAANLSGTPALPNGTTATTQSANDNSTKIATTAYVNAITVPVKATGAELDTGTDDTKFATAKAINDSHNVPSVAPGTSGNVMTSNGTDWVSSAPAGGGKWEFIAEAQLTSASATLIDATSISTDYDSFRITTYGIGAASDKTYVMTFNGDTGNNYITQQLYVNGTSISAYRETPASKINLFAGNGKIFGGSFFQSFITVSKPLATAPAMIKVDTSNYDTSSVNDEHISGRWNNTSSKITRITINSSGTSFAAGSLCLIEGYKKV